MGDQYIYIYGKGNLNYPISELEDDLQESIEGIAEISGTGIGISGWNIDIESLSVESIDNVLGKIDNIIMKYVSLLDQQNINIDISGTKVSYKQIHDNLEKKVNKKM